MAKGRVLRGRLGRRRMRSRGLVHALLCGTYLVVLGGMAGGCASPESVVGFDEADTGARMRAIRQAASSGDESAVPGLIGRLESDDPAERLLAIRVLEKLTGQTQGFDYAASIEQRDASIRRWVEWYEGEHKVKAGGISAMSARMQQP